MGGSYLVELLQELLAVLFLVDSMQIYHNLRHIFNRQKF